MKLTERQQIVLRQLATYGRTNQQISDATGIGVNSVKAAIRDMCEEHGFGGPDKTPRMQLAIWGWKNGYGTMLPRRAA